MMKTWSGHGEGWEAEMYVKKKKMKLRENGRRERKVKLGIFSNELGLLGLCKWELD